MCIAMSIALMISSFDNGDFNLELPITKIKLAELKCYLVLLSGSGLLCRVHFFNYAKKLKPETLNCCKLLLRVYAVCICVFEHFAKHYFGHTIFTVLLGYFSKLN